MFILEKYFCNNFEYLSPTINELIKVSDTKHCKIDILIIITGCLLQTSIDVRKLIIYTNEVLTIKD